MKAPKDWTEVKVKTFVELKTLFKEEYDDAHEYLREHNRILSELPERELRKVDMDDFTEFMLRTVWSFKAPANKFDKDVGDYLFKGFDELTLGEYIDLTTYFEDDYIVNLPRILSVLYRKTKVGEWGETIIEPYRVIDVEKRAEELGELPIGCVYGVISEFIQFRKDLINNRKPLFGIDDEDDDDEEEEKEEEEPRTPDEADKQEIEELKIKWSWELMLYNLCKRDLTKLEEVTELNLFVVFNFASMKHELKLD